MSNEKEIRSKISSIKNTQKITKAMEMVAASKMRRAQERMAASRPYAEKIRSAIAHVAGAHLEYRHPYFERRENIKSIGIILISTDRGLCGGLNVNLFKKALFLIREWQARGAETEICAIGGKAVRFFQRHVKLASQATQLGDSPRIEDMIGSIKVMLDAYSEGRTDRLFLIENRFVSTMTQTPQVTQLIPAEQHQDDTKQHAWDYIYEPDAQTVLDTMLQRYIESQIYQATVENVACEMAARMIAMNSASDNAGSLIDELQLTYNKARQATITREISEIVGGAAAV